MDTENETDAEFLQRMHDRAKKAMAAATECPTCGNWPTFTFQQVGEHMAVFCETCGEEKGVGFGNTPTEAVAAWNVLPPPCVHACGSRAETECSHGRTCGDCFKDACADNARPDDFPCAGYAGCTNTVDDEDGVCGDCEARGENTGGCPGCGGNCQTACR